jgi:hypothetical protein
MSLKGGFKPPLSPPIANGAISRHQPALISLISFMSLIFRFSLWAMGL